jgi:hypothetical protein
VNRSRILGASWVYSCSGAGPCHWEGGWESQSSDTDETVVLFAIAASRSIRRSNSTIGESFIPSLLPGLGL